MTKKTIDFEIKKGVFADLTLNDVKQRFGSRISDDLLEQAFGYALDMGALDDDDFIAIVECIQLGIAIETIDNAIIAKYSIGYDFGEIRQRMNPAVLGSIIQRHFPISDTVLLALYYQLDSDFVAVPYGIHDAKMLVKKATVDGVAITPVGVLLQPDNPRFCVSPFWLVGSNGILVKIADAYDLLNYF